jgi:hypothetical protein
MIHATMTTKNLNEEEESRKQIIERDLRKRVT